MPAGFCGSWEILSNVNFEGYMTALGKSLTRADITSLLKYNGSSLSLFSNMEPAMTITFNKALGRR